MKRSLAITFLASLFLAFVGSGGNAALAQTAMRPDSPRDVVARQVEAVNAHDVDAVTKFHAPNATMLAFPSGKILAHGSRAVHALFTNLFSKSPKFQLTLTRQLLNGNIVINHYAISNGPGAELTTIYEVAGGTISREWLVMPKT